MVVNYTNPLMVVNNDEYLLRMVNDTVNNGSKGGSMIIGDGG